MQNEECFIEINSICDVQHIFTNLYWLCNRSGLFPISPGSFCDLCGMAVGGKQTKREKLIPNSNVYSLKTYYQVVIKLHKQFTQNETVT